MSESLKTSARDLSSLAKSLMLDSGQLLVPPKRSRCVPVTVLTRQTSVDAAPTAGRERFLESVQALARNDRTRRDAEFEIYAIEQIGSSPSRLQPNSLRYRASRRCRREERSLAHEWSRLDPGLESAALADR